MRHMLKVCGVCLIALTAILTSGCEKEPPPPPPATGRPPIEKPASPPPKPETPEAPTATAPPAHPVAPSGTDISKPAPAPATVEGSTLKLAGITLTLPEGWTSEPITPGPLAPVAVLKIPRLTPDGADGSVRITHYPNMKGMPGIDESNIQRWIGQVTKADGSPATKEDATIQTVEVGKIRLTTVDISGTIRVAMREQPQPDSRMIAAIVDHPQGPHFVVASGSAKSMESWAAPIMGFLKGAQAD